MYYSNDNTVVEHDPNAGQAGPLMAAISNATRVPNLLYRLKVSNYTYRNLSPPKQMGCQSEPDLCVIACHCKARDITSCRVCWIALWLHV